MTGVVVTDAPRVAAEVREGFTAHDVATVHEAQGRRGLLRPELSPIYHGPVVVGTAVTVSVPPGDNWMIHVAVEQSREGDLLVVAPTSPSDVGYFGELLATALAARGVRGLVIDAGCRDVAPLTAMGFPVWSRCISAEGTVKETLGEVNRPIVCGGQIVNPGDVVVADDDGVVVAARTEAVEVLALAGARADTEAAVRKRYETGEVSLDVGGMRERLARKGLTYVAHDASSDDVGP